MTITLTVYTAEQIERRLNESSRLPSLSSINLALQELLNSETSDLDEIGDVIQRDPSMTARILKLVNSVTFGINYRVQNVQEAVLFLGLRQVRQVAMLTPVIDEFQNLPLDTEFSWRNFWKHCLAVALLTQEILMEESPELADLGYISGLIHDLGKIAISHVFPEHFHQIYNLGRYSNPEALTAEEKALLGDSHAGIGATYARLQKLERPLCEAIEFHHQPALAPRYPRIAAAVQIADGITHLFGIGASGVQWEMLTAGCLKLPGWRILFPNMTREQRESQLRQFMNHAGHLHEIVDNLV